MSVCRRVAGLILCLCATGAACSQSGGPPPKPKVELLSTVASSTEDGDPQEFRIELTFANVGEGVAPLGTVELVNAGLYKSPQLRVAQPEFTLAPDVDLSHLAKGETRVVTFLASDRNRYLCPKSCGQNPHVDLLQVEASVISGAGEWFVQTDVVVTCANELPRVCTADLATGCQGTDAAGQPLRCLPTWTEVLADSLCGLADSDLTTKCLSNMNVRTIRVADIDYQYYYYRGTLTGVTSSKDSCLAGPCAGPMVPQPGVCEQPKAFYQCDVGLGNGAGLPEGTTNR